MGAVIEIMDSEFLALRKIHNNFTLNDYFTAFSLVTHQSDWLWIDINDRNVERKVKEAKEKHIFNLVVKDHGTTLGYVNVLDLKDNKITKLEKVDKHTIPSSTPLYKLSGMMLKDANNIKRERSPIYFVKIPEPVSREPIGLVTYWDLNRAPSYIFSYSILVYLEQTIFLKIRDSHKLWEDHRDFLDKIRGYMRPWEPKLHISWISQFISGPNYNYKILSKWGLPELLAFYPELPDSYHH